jgi:hypothetical protein
LPSEDVSAILPSVCGVKQLSKKRINRVGQRITNSGNAGVIVQGYRNFSGTFDQPNNIFQSGIHSSQPNLSHGNIGPVMLYFRNTGTVRQIGIRPVRIIKRTDDALFENQMFPDIPKLSCIP